MENTEQHDLENIFKRNIMVAGFLAAMILLIIIILAVAVDRNKNYSQINTSAIVPTKVSEGDFGNVNLPQEIKEYNYDYDKLNEGGN